MKYRLSIFCLVAGLLAGCTPAALFKVAATGDEVVGAVQARGTEIVVERQDARAEKRRANAAIRQVWWDVGAVKKSTGDLEGAVAAYDKVLENVDATYPDLVKFIEELDAVSDAIKAARADDP